jgi:glycosyltransferase involved in cell wall biosynthesis
MSRGANADLGSVARGRLRAIFLAIEQLIDRFTLNEADEVVAVNDCVKRELVRQGASKHEMLIISNGIETNKFCKGGSSAARSSLRREFGLKDDEVGVAFVGRLSHEKNLTTLLKAFAKPLPKFQRM